MAIMAVNEVKDKVAIVTGAASGIGRATAERLHARGAKVAAKDINPEVEKLASSAIVTLVADISQDGSAERAIALTLERFGRLDILVNNTARILYKPVEPSRLEPGCVVYTRCYAT
jgi:NAD(P)-dependent dehydrogenase (short-subunit alcohol dehydrogenase family)